jgi:preprotein translocase subunit SecD
MTPKTLWKTGFVVLLLIVSVFYLYPNVVWYSLPLEKRQELSSKKDPRAKKVIPLGLDLQGGVHLVYQVDVNKLPDLADETVSRAIEQNMVVIQNRIDALGVANAFVARQGDQFVLIQMPGVFRSEEAKSIIGKTAMLEFRMVREHEALLKIIQEIDARGLRPDDVVRGHLPDDVKTLIPEGLALLPSREGGYLLVNVSADLTGSYLKQARVEFGGGDGMIVAGGPTIGFELNADGAKLFEVLTRAHVGERLAIVLDGLVQSAPRIESPIPGGRGQITGQFSAQEAKLLANILNSGNLEAPMTVVEERTVGPEMGEDSIRAGMKAVAIGFFLVVLFIFFNYRISGILANVALVLNLLFLMSAMNWLHATLTMPGIAGIILSLAMAIDANVLILERVREELAKGKMPRAAIDEGYKKAFSAIFDGNLTTIIPALFLFQFGAGPVKGFAVTLLIGLVISVFTAVFVTRLFYEIWFDIAHPKTISV